MENLRGADGPDKLELEPEGVGVGVRAGVRVGVGDAPLETHGIPMDILEIVIPQGVVQDFLRRAEGIPESLKTFCENRFGKKPVSSHPHLG